jgi:hypothetical protein
MALLATPLPPSLAALTTSLAALVAVCVKLDDILESNQQEAGAQCAGIDPGRSAISVRGCGGCAAELLGNASLEAVGSLRPHVQALCIVNGVDPLSRCCR